MAKDANRPRPAITKNDLAAKAAEYLAEMELYGGLEVVLIPAPDPNFTGHMVRAAQSSNPPWYRRFAAQYTNCRGIGRKRMQRPRTYIVRYKVVNALRRLAAGDFRFEQWPYHARLIDFMTIEISNERERDRVSKNPDEYDYSSYNPLDGIPF